MFDYVNFLDNFRTTWVRSPYNGQKIVIFELFNSMTTGQAPSVEDLEQQINGVLS